METCSTFYGLFYSINWLWYTVAVIIAYAIGALWYSTLFSKTWMRVFKVEMPEKVDKSNAFLTMFAQLAASALLALVMFMLTAVSAWFAALVLIGFCGWQKASLKFRFAKWKDFREAVMVDVGYLFIVGVIFILCASI